MFGPDGLHDMRPSIQFQNCANLLQSFDLGFRPFNNTSLLLLTESILESEFYMTDS